MARALKNRSSKVGLPPGTPVYIGDKKSASFNVETFCYDDSKCEHKIGSLDESCKFSKKSEQQFWINVDGLQNVDELKSLTETFDVHSLVLEDISNTDQRPKVEDYEKYLYLVVKMISFNEQDSKIESEQISFILGKNFLLSFQELPGGDVFNPIRERIKVAGNKIRKSNPDFLLYSLLDVIIDNYFVVMEKFGERIEYLEDDLIKSSKGTIQNLHNLKREMLFLRQSIWPLREVISGLERFDNGLIKTGTKLYLRDIYDHTVHIIDVIETYRDMISGMVDIYLSSINNKLSEIVKVLTIITTIFMPLTLVVGFYGMNFHYIPLLSSPFGYLFVLGIMLTSVTTMLILFRRKGWM